MRERSPMPMKPGLACIIFASLSTGLMGQSHSDHPLIGSWQLTGYGWPIRGSFSPVATSYTDITTYYADSVFQTITKGYDDEGSEQVLAGTWELDREGGRILRRNVHGIPQEDGVTWEAADLEIGEITDSTLVIEGFEGDLPVRTHYKRVADPGRLEDPYVPRARPSRTEPRLKHTIFLVNSMEARKRIKLKSGVGISIRDSAPDTTAVDRNIHWSGTLLDVTDSTISIAVSFETISFQSKDGIMSEVENDFMYMNGDMERTMGIGRIDHLTYTSPARQTLHSIGSTMATVGSLTALLIAPLASIGYKQGGFDSDRYFLLAGAGLAGLSIGIPLVLLGKEKKYRISDGNTKVGKHYWHLRRE